MQSNSNSVASDIPKRLNYFTGSMSVLTFTVWK